MRVFGWAAGILSMLHNIPQIVHMWRRKSAKDVSPFALNMRMISLIFYVTHGILIEDPPLIVMSSLIFLQCVIISIQMYKYHGVFVCSLSSKCAADTAASLKSTTVVTSTAAESPATCPPLDTTNSSGIPPIIS